jgi:CTP:molybdopterin cytidylyltransferase MocA
LFQHAERVIVVVGWGGSLAVRGLSAGVEIIRAPDWRAGGQSDSIRLALGDVHGGRVLVQPVDVPPVSSGVVRALCAAGGSAVPVWRGRPGHPVMLAQPLIEELRATHPRDGLRGLLGDAQRVVVEDPSVCWNLNDPRQLARWLRSGSPLTCSVRDGPPATR